MHQNSILPHDVNRLEFSEGVLFCPALQVERGIDLVYGGGSIGLMGLVSHAVHAGGRHVIGLVSISLAIPLHTIHFYPPGGLPTLAVCLVFLWCSCSGRFASSSSLHQNRTEMAALGRLLLGLGLHCPLEDGWGVQALPLFHSVSQKWKLLFGLLFERLVVSMPAMAMRRVPSCKLGASAAP